LSENLSLKGEYLFVPSNQENVIYNTDYDEDIDFSNQSHLLPVELSCKFSGPGS
jgi:hypothetical protein